MNIKELQQERKQLFNDFWNNKTPKRLPISVGVYHQIVIEYAKEDVFETQYDYGRLTKASDEICQKVYSDICPISGGGTPRFVFFNQILDSQCFVQGSTGFMQHPEVVGMHEDEYPELLKDPYAFILGKVIPRQYRGLDPATPIARTLSLQFALDAKAKDAGDFAALSVPLVEKYGYYPGAPKGSNASVISPFDFLADIMRGFSGVSIDIRRDRNKVKEACDALYPFIFLAGLAANPNPEGQVALPLHMPTFMREKDFVDIYLPTFLRLIREYAALGIRSNLYCEDDWTRYLDIVREFPAGTMIRFEYGDPKQIADKLGDKFYLGGFFPTSLLSMGTKQQCIDKAKELLDIMMPHVGWIFGFDKRPLVLTDINIEYLGAVTEYLRDHAIFENPGKPFGGALNSEGYTVDVAKSSYFESKYKFDWDEFKKKNPYAPDIAKKRYAELELKTLKFYMSFI
jgi:hypothetical protein